MLDLTKFDENGDAGYSWYYWYGKPAQRRDDNWELTSPYNQLRLGLKLPPILAFVAASDDRVSSKHSRNFITKLREVGSEGWYFEAPGGGHIFPDRNEMDEERALIYSFFWKHLTDKSSAAH